MEGLIIFILFIFVITCASLITDEIDSRDDRKNKLKKRVTNGFKKIEESSRIYGKEYSACLRDYAYKMNKLESEEVKKYLKPYDTYSVKYFHKFLGRIIIDKNLVPRFMVTNISSSDIIKDTDFQLSFALTSDEVMKLAEKCDKIFMEKNDEIHRKNKVIDYITYGQKV